MPSTNHEPTIDIDAPVADQVEDFSDLNGGYVYEADAYVPAGSSSLADVDPSTITEINEVAGDLLDKNPNVRKRFARVLATAGGAAALSFLLAACGTTGTPTPTHSISTSAKPSPTPSETATATATNPFGGELATSPDTISSYKTMDLDKFRALEPTERTALFLSYAEDPQNGLAAYAKMYEYISGNTADTLPATISVDNTPQEILTIMTYGQRFALSFDQATAEKVLAGTMYSVTSNSYAVMDGVLKEYAPISARVLGAESTNQHGILTGTLVSAGPKEKNSDGTASITLIISQSDGTKVSVPCHFVTNGTSGMWESDQTTIVK